LPLEETMGGANDVMNRIVRWVREFSETSDTGPGMGVRFEQLSSQTAKRIRQFLASRPPLFFED
jgi:hypothetical protein